MHIPHKTTEAALTAFDEWDDPQLAVEAALRAAGPIMAAQALREAAEGVGTWADPRRIALLDPDAHVARGYLRALADELENQA